MKLVDLNSQITLVLPVFNGLSLTQGFIKSWYQTGTSGHKLIIVNDCSTDGSFDYLSGLSDSRIQLIHNESNLGYAAACNLGGELAKTDYLCFLNNDLILKPDWLSPMADGMIASSKIGAVGSVQLNPSTQLVDHVGIYFDLIGLPHHAGHKFKRISNRSLVEWSAVTAACFVVRKSVFDEIGGFDTIYRNGYEDVDLCMRLRECGYQHFVANNSRVLHHVSKSPGRKLYEDRNAKIFIERWGELTRQLGRREWPLEYLRICRNRPSKIRFGQLTKAVWMLLTNGSPAGI